MHALPLAEELKVRKVIVPVNSSVFSAWGMLLTDLRRDYVQTRPLYFNADNHRRVLETFARLRKRRRRTTSATGSFPPLRNSPSNSTETCATRARSIRSRCR